MSCGSAGAQDDASLRASLQPIVSAHHGSVALFAIQLNTGKTITISPDLPIQTASDIKLAILYTAMQEIRSGRAHWDEPITMTASDVVGGSGILHFFDTPKLLTLKDVLTMMVIVSDNTATNLAIDRFGLDTINVRMAALGLHDTHLYKKVFKPANGPMPADQPIFGLGKSTPREMTVLMTEIGACRLRPAPPLPPAKPGIGMVAPSTLPMDADDKAVCDIALSMLKNQFYRDTIPRYLPNGGDQTVASKTGSLDAVRSDVAIIAAKSGPIVLSIFTFGNADHRWTVENEAERTIARLAQTIVAAWSPDGLDPKLLTPGLGLEPISTPAVKKP